ncbi:MAG TPA: hypothetical protein VLA64_10665 [Azonexus sp.]|nr:hypothetical protein [Azonexus sp.]
MKIRPSFLLLPLTMALAIPAQAARPMITDDARLTDAGACQVETWVHTHREQREFWALPACNPGGNFELTFGGALADADGQKQSGAMLVQGKTLFKPLETNGWGIGLAAGYATQPGSEQSGSPYFYIPLSFSLADDQLVIHTNLGNLRERETQKNRLTWGIGGELQTTERLYVIAESYGQDQGNAFFQTGLRYWLLPGHIQIDTTYGSRFGQIHQERWFSIGLRLITPSL